MRVTSIDCHTVDMALSKPYSIASRRIAEVSNVIVVVRTDSAGIGLGAAAPEPLVTGETPADCAAAVAEHAPTLVGRDTSDLVGNCRALQIPLARFPAARAALDMALHDLFAQQLGKPLVEVLGRVHDGLPTSVTIGIQGAEATLEEAREHLAAGFRVLKVKLGDDLHEDLQRLRRLRATLGTACTIRVDANQGYSLAELNALLARREALGLELIEQPLAVQHDQALASLPPAARRLLAADEALQTEADALRLLAPPLAYGIWNIKLMKCGGLFAARRMADMAEIAGLALMWGCMDESVISISAALHLALASPATRYLDLDGSLELARDVARGGFELRDGVMRTLEQPGLGVRLSSVDGP